MDQDDMAELEEEFWEALDASRTVMLNAIGTQHYAARPMTAQTDKDISDGSIYFFASRGEGIGQEVLDGAQQARMTFQSDGHKILASAVGPIKSVDDKAMIEKLWSPIADIYYEGGKSDPDLVLLRFQPPVFEVWRNRTVGMLKAIAYKLTGRDGGQAYQENRGTLPA